MLLVAIMAQTCTNNRCAVLLFPCNPLNLNPRHNALSLEPFRAFGVILGFAVPGLQVLFAGCSGVGPREADRWGDLGFYGSALQVLVSRGVEIGCRVYPKP